jgi:hypothetical protein
VQACVLDLDEPAGWRMRRLNPRNAYCGNRHEYAKHNGKCDYGSHGDITVFGSFQVETKTARSLSEFPSLTLS